MTEEVAVVAEAEKPAPIEPASEESVVEELPKEEPKPRTYTQEDLDRITAKVKKNEHYRTKKEIEAYYQGRESVKPEPKPEASVDDTPKRESFDTYEAFLEAKADYAGRKAAREERAKLDKESSEKNLSESRAKVVTSFQEKTREKFPDLEERLAEVSEKPMYVGVQDAIAESEFGPEILNDLVSKPEELDRLMKLSPTAAIREIGKIEARFEAGLKNPPPVKKPSNVPEPIKPVNLKTVSGDEEPSTDKTEAWMAWRQRQIRNRKSA